jgi:hypothetical protein
MKIKTITYLLLITALFYGCSKCEKTTREPEIVGKTDLPNLFPYNESVGVKFLKNKIDTVVFNSLGLKTTYNYTETQTDCPTIVPLEQKYIPFIDSVGGNSFYLNYYVSSSYFNYFSITINNKVICNAIKGEFAPTEPVVTSTVLGKKYDTVSVWNNHEGDSVIFKTIKGGVLKFTSNGNLFELIP